MPTKAQKHKSKMRSIEERIDRAAALYDPAPANKPETNDGNSKGKLQSSTKKVVFKGGKRKTIGGRGLNNPSSGVPPKGHKSARRSLADTNNKRAPPPIMNVVDQGIVKRYKRLQASSLEYMHLIETEARKLLEAQQKVMQASLHLEHIRKEHGGYVTSATVLNSGERGSKEALAKEKAFFEQHIANLESELVAANKMVSKEVIVQDKIRKKIDNQRRIIWTKKHTFIKINSDIESYRNGCKKFRHDVHELQIDCTKEKSRMERMKQTEKSIIQRMASEIQRVHQQKMHAATQFKNNMTSSKQEVERHRRKVNLERLKSQPRRPHSSQGTTRKSLRSRVKKKVTSNRPRTAGGKLVFSKTKNFVNKADVLKGSRNAQKNSTADKNPLGSLFGGGSEENDDDDDDEEENDAETAANMSMASKKPKSLKPTFDDDPLAMHDPTKNPRIWMPGRAQTRSDPSADHTPSSANIPSPLGRRGSLVGRAPGRFGSPSKLNGRLELLLSTLPEIENKKKLIKQRGAAMSWQLARKQQKTEAVTESIKELEKLFDKIRQRTGINTIEEFASVFMESEARQFTVVKQVEELESKLSSVHHNNTLIKKEIEELKKKASVSKENSLFEKITQEISGVKQQTSTHHKQFTQRKNQLHGCIQNVEQLLKVVDSKHARLLTGLNEEQAEYIKDLLEPTGGVTDSLLPQCLGSIEERVLQLLQIYEIKIAHDGRRRARAPGSRYSSRPGSRLNQGLSRSSSSDSNDLFRAVNTFPRPPTATRTTTFGEVGGHSRKIYLVGGNLPVKDQVQKKFGNSPAWVLKMAVDMHDELSGENGLAEDAEDSDDVEYDDDDEDEEVDDFHAELEAALESSTATLVKVKRQKNNTSRTASSPSPELGNVRIIMPRDEELETSNDDTSSDEEDESSQNGGRTSIARPISRQDMKNRAMDLAKRRSDIERFLGTNHALQRERNRYVIIFFCLLLVACCLLFVV